MDFLNIFFIFKNLSLYYTKYKIILLYQKSAFGGKACLLQYPIKSKKSQGHRKFYRLSNFN